MTDLQEDHDYHNFAIIFYVCHNKHWANLNAPFHNCGSGIPCVVLDPERKFQKFSFDRRHNRQPSSTSFRISFVVIRKFSNSLHGSPPELERYLCTFLQSSDTQNTDISSLSVGMRIPREMAAPERTRKRYAFFNKQVKVSLSVKASKVIMEGWWIAINCQWIPREVSLYGVQ